MTYEDKCLNLYKHFDTLGGGGYKQKKNKINMKKVSTANQTLNQMEVPEMTPFFKFRVSLNEKEKIIAYETSATPFSIIPLLFFYLMPFYLKFMLMVTVVLCFNTNMYQQLQEIFSNGFGVVKTHSKKTLDDVQRISSFVKSLQEDEEKSSESFDDEEESSEETEESSDGEILENEGNVDDELSQNVDDELSETGNEKKVIENEYETPVVPPSTPVLAKNSNDFTRLPDSFRKSFVDFQTNYDDNSYLSKKNGD